MKKLLLSLCLFTTVYASQNEIITDKPCVTPNPPYIVKYPMDNESAMNEVFGVGPREEAMRKILSVPHEPQTAEQEG